MNWWRLAKKGYLLVFILIIKLEFKLMVLNNATDEGEPMVLNNATGEVEPLGLK